MATEQRLRLLKDMRAARAKQPTPGPRVIRRHISKKKARRPSFVLQYKPPENPHIHKSVESIANLIDPPVISIHHKGDYEREELTASQEPLVQLRELARVFQSADEDKGGGLDAVEFREAMRITNADLSDREADMIFMKVDTDCNGLVDWDEFLRYMFLEILEKAQMRSEEMQPFPKRARLIVAVDHREEIVRIVHAGPPHSRYISIGRDAVIGFWTTDMEPKNFKCIEHDTASQKSTWITDCALIPRAHLLALCSTACDIQFYDINVNRFQRMSRITGLHDCPMSITYFDSPDIDNDSMLILGDGNGSVTCITIDCPFMMSPINPKRSRYGRQIIPLSDIMHNHVTHVKAHYWLRLHGDIVRDIMYSAHLGAIISVCQHPSTAIHVGDLTRQRLASYYKVPRGVSTFDYSNKLNIIVTGGPDAVVRVWNPYVTARAVTVLRGHQSAILRIHLNAAKEQIVSIAENKEIRVHDLDTQTCVQMFHRQFIPLVGNRKISASLFNPAKQELIFATTWLAVLGHREEEINYQQLISHKQPVVAVLYNPLFQQVISTDTDSVVAVWNLADGQKHIQYRVNVDDEGEYSADESLTAICFDSTYRRLISGARDGKVCIWNFNSGACLREYPIADTSEITSVVCDKRRIITGGWNGHVAMFDDTADDFDRFKVLSPAHERDLLSIAIYPPNIVASSSFDGHVYVWYLNSMRLMVEIEIEENTDGSGAVCDYRHMYGKHPLKTMERARIHKDSKVALPKISSKTKDKTAITKEKHTKKHDPKHKTVPAVNIDGSKGADRGPSAEPSSPQKRNTPVYNKSTLQPSRAERRRPTSGIGRDTDLERFSSGFITPPEIVGENRSKGLSIEKIVLLRNRVMHAKTAILFVACGDGIVRAWSLTHDGGLLGQFAASHYPGDSLTSLLSVRNDEFLVTSDTAGYLKVWDISHYVLAGRRCCVTEHLKRSRVWLRHPLLAWMKTLHEHKRFNTAFPNMKQSHASGDPHLLTSFRAHVDSINSVDYLSKGGVEYLLTAGIDCSIRMWTITGLFVGLFGQKHLWNFGRKLVLPSRRVGQYRADGLHHVPPDVHRVASCTTLHVMYHNVPNGWTTMANSVRIACTFINVLREKYCVGAVEVKEEPIDWQVTSVVLGKHYTPRTRHKTMPILPKPGMYRHQKLAVLEEIIPQCMPSGATRMIPCLEAGIPLLPPVTTPSHRTLPSMGSAAIKK